MAANPVSIAHSTFPTKAMLLAFIRRLCDEEEYEPEEGHWTFRSGGSCGICTEGAKKVAIEFDGQVVGYRTADNPSAVVSKYVDGHDFALIVGRFVVDYWARHVAEEIDRAVFDLNDPDEAKLVRRYYGKQSTWQSTPISDEDLKCLRIERGSEIIGQTNNIRPGKQLRVSRDPAGDGRALGERQSDETKLP